MGELYDRFVGPDSLNPLEYNTKCMISNDAGTGAREMSKQEMDEMERLNIEGTKSDRITRAFTEMDILQERAYKGGYSFSEFTTPQLSITMTNGKMPTMTQKTYCDTCIKNDVCTKQEAYHAKIESLIQIGCGNGSGFSMSISCDHFAPNKHFDKIHSHKRGL